MTDRFIEGGGWSDRDMRRQPLEHNSDISVTFLFLLGIPITLLGLGMIGLDFYAWWFRRPDSTPLTVWGWLGMDFLICEIGLLLILTVRCQETGVGLIEMVRKGFVRRDPMDSRAKTMRRSYKETIEEMRKLYTGRG